MARRSDLVRTDLHGHSCLSDGLFSPTEYVNARADEQLEVIALSDHDILSGVDAAAKVAKTCVGIDHFEGFEVALIIAAIVAALGVALFSLSRTGWRAIVSGLVSGVGQALLFLYVLVIVSLKHLFSNPETGLGEYGFVAVGLVLVSTNLIAVIRAIVQSVRARRAS